MAKEQVVLLVLLREVDCDIVIPLAFAGTVMARRSSIHSIYSAARKLSTVKSSGLSAAIAARGDWRSPPRDRHGEGVDFELDRQAARLRAPASDSAQFRTRYGFFTCFCCRRLKLVIGVSQSRPAAGLMPGDSVSELLSGMVSFSQWPSKRMFPRTGLPSPVHSSAPSRSRLSRFSCSSLEFKVSFVPMIPFAYIRRLLVWCNSTRHGGATDQRVNVTVVLQMMIAPMVEPPRQPLTAAW